jgi:lipopolysaccharide transport system ATP-binding protein
MSSEAAISANGLGKAYRIGHQHSDAVTLTEAALERLHHPLRRNTRELFWALRDVDFSIRAGSVVGLIGRNGSGKSTLLKLLSRITPPSSGTARLRGRVGSLLEVGTGFHQELTGRENIYLNGAILGMTKQDVRRCFDSIVDFAGVSAFLDTPVKRYSTGMYVRLAFAVAAHLTTEILLVDEVLSVGDAAFQRKCLGSMREAGSTGRTVIFVSHQMAAITALCDNAMYLEDGRLRYHGPTADAVQQYLGSFRSDQGQAEGARAGLGEWRITHAVAAQPAYRVEEDKVVEFTALRRHNTPNGFWAWAHFVDDQGTLIAKCDSRLSDVVVAPEFREVTMRLALRSPWLRPGRYFVDLFLGDHGLFDGYERACSFEVLPVLPYPVAADEEALSGGPVLPEFQFERVTEVR